MLVENARVTLLMGDDTMSLNQNYTNHLMDDVAFDWNNT